MYGIIARSYNFCDVHLLRSLIFITYYASRWMLTVVNVDEGVHARSAWRILLIILKINLYEYSSTLRSWYDVTQRITVLSLKIRHSKFRHFQESSPNVFSLLTNFRFSNIRHITLIIRLIGCLFQHFVTTLLFIVYTLES